MERTDDLAIAKEWIEEEGFVGCFVDDFEKNTAMHLVSGADRGGPGVTVVLEVFLETWNWKDMNGNIFEREERNLYFEHGDFMYGWDDDHDEHFKCAYRLNEWEYRNWKAVVMKQSVQDD